MENKICGICGKAVAPPGPTSEPDGVFTGWQDVTLHDGNMICKDCAEKVRILYPLRSIKTFVASSARFGSTEIRGKAVSKRGWLNLLVDPLENLTLEEFRRALSEAEHAVEEQAARFPGAKGAAEADFTYRHYVKAGGTNQNPRYSDAKEYFTCVKVLYGEIRPGDTVYVPHKDRDYMAKVDAVWFWNYLDSPQREIDRAFAGTTVGLLFRQDVPFIYPGDVLVVKDN